MKLRVTSHLQFAFASSLLALLLSSASVLAQDVMSNQTLKSNNLNTQVHAQHNFASKLTKLNDESQRLEQQRREQQQKEQRLEQQRREQQQEQERLDEQRREQQREQQRLDQQRREQQRNY